MRTGWKAKKQEVQYTESHKGTNYCGRCAFFILPGLGSGYCRRVSGTIKPSGWCQLFERNDAVKTRK